jgi:hypothetical protein
MTPAAVHGDEINKVSGHHLMRNTASNLRVEDAGMRFPQNVNSHA